MDQQPLDELQICTFGGGETADRMLDLVLSGRKTAASWPARDGQWTQVGARMIACDRHGQPRAVLETTSLERKRFCDVDEAFAWAEAEGDLSLAWWRLVNRRLLARSGEFSDDVELWCERFRVVTVLAPPAEVDAPVEPDVRLGEEAAFAYA